MKNTTRIRLAWLGVSLLAGLVPNLGAQEPTISLLASNDHVELGSGFAVAGDLDGDGVVDVAVADRSGRISSFAASGVVHIVSGGDGSILRTYTGSPAASQNFGASLVALNADGDGIPDLAVGSPGQSDAGVFGAGAVRIYSGADGSLLSFVVGSYRSQMGTSLANAGDQNGDGFDDLYVGAPLADSSRGVVHVISGSDGTILRGIATDASTSSFGLTLATLDDMDGDGLRDLAVGAPGFRSGFNPVGRVLLVRSSDGSVASQIAGSGNYTRLGESLANAADVNGDGLSELLVGSYSGGTALLVSGADLSTLDDLSVPTLPLFRRLIMGGSLDFDGDGIQDWLIGSSGLGINNGQVVGAIRVVSGVDHSTLFERVAATAFTGLGNVLKVIPGLGFAAGETSLRNPETLGYGAAYVWRLVVDSDGDGVLDADDANPQSIMDETVTILGLDSGVANRVDGQGITIADRFLTIGEPADYPNSALYYVEVLHLANSLASEHLLDQDEVRKIRDAARVGSMPSKGRR